jgi:putative hemolysin
MAQTAPLVGDLRFGDLEVRLATTPEEVDAAQALRYQIFYEEMAAQPSAETLATQRDVDIYDTVCDHLLVLDHSKGPGAAAVVGTYRLIRREAADQVGDFYTASEFDISALLRYPGKLLELGRSCVDANHRNRPTMNLLWRGIATYVLQHDIAIMFGCASLPGIEPKALATPLSYLYYHHLAPPAVRTKALPHRYADMKLLPPGDVDPKQGLAELPPLVKGYLRLGGFIGDGAVIDDQFNTTDVCIIVKTDLITDKYLQHYTRNREA